MLLNVAGELEGGRGRDLHRRSPFERMIRLRRCTLSLLLDNLQERFGLDSELSCRIRQPIPNHISLVFSKKSLDGAYLAL